MTFQFTGTDAMNSVLNRIADDGQCQRQSFSPYGGNSTALAHTLGFNGERRDPLTSTTHLGNGYRAYNPILMHFHAPDSMSPFGAGGINCYAYCSGDPINRSDPSGHMYRQTRGGKRRGPVGRIAMDVIPGGDMAIAAVRGLEAGRNRSITKRITNNSETYFEKIKRLQTKQKSVEKATMLSTACDVKAQTVLREIRKDSDLWGAFDNALEVRVIKEKRSPLILHPKDEYKERWSGKYHVYVTLQHDEKKLVLDPYIGGNKSFAHIDEQEFIKFNWKGEEGKEYTLETVAPVPEIYEGGDYTPEFTLQDYMDDLFDRDTYKSHGFYYD